MAIVMGLDQHRGQITGEWIESETGEVQRMRVAPADRAHVRQWLSRFRGRELEVALEWSIEPTPPTVTGLSGVSCTSQTACTAVGGKAAERWNGTTWSTERTPKLPRDTNGGLSAVSCASATACIAVGTYAYPNPDALVERWTSGR